MDFELCINNIKTSLTAISSIKANEVLKDRADFIYQQISIMEKAYIATQNELNASKDKIAELEKKITAYKEKEQFVQY